MLDERESCMPQDSEFYFEEDSCEIQLVEDENETVKHSNYLNERCSNAEKMRLSLYQKSSNEFQNQVLALFQRNVSITEEKIHNIAGMSAELFFVLYDFLQNYMTVLCNVSKVEQLVCVLGKLRHNETYIVSEFHFPLVFVSNIDIFFDVFRIINATHQFFPLIIPKFVENAFLPIPQRVAAIDVLKIKLKSESSEIHEVNYLLAYTLGGRIVFNSKKLPEISILHMIDQTGVLKSLRRDARLLIRHTHKSAELKTTLEDGIYLVNYSVSNNNLQGNIRKIALDVENYVNEITSRLQIAFPILNDFFPFYMTQTTNAECFLDKLIYVCCNLYNVIHIK